MGGKTFPDVSSPKRAKTSIADCEDLSGSGRIPADSPRFPETRESPTKVVLPLVPEDSRSELTTSRTMGMPHLSLAENLLSALSVQFCVASATRNWILAVGITQMGEGKGELEGSKQSWEQRGKVR